MWWIISKLDWRRISQYLSSAVAIPIPPPIHIVAMALFFPVRCNSEAALQVILAPEALNGWPKDTAPPSRLTFSISIPNSSLYAKLCEENASFYPNINIVCSPIVLSIHNREAAIGPRPIRSGGQPVTDVDTILAIGVRLFSVANRSLQTIANVTPSVNGEDVAAVTVPDSLKTGFSPAIDCNY